MGWLDTRPEVIVDQADPSDLLGALRSDTAALSPERALVLDHVLRQWTLRALSRPGDLEGLLQLDELAFLAIERLDGEANNTAALRSRWGAFRDLLESKRLAVAGSKDGRAQNLLHADKVLHLLDQGPIAQSSLPERLRVTAARVSQILAVMEEAGLIRREKKGRENVVSRSGPGAASPAGAGPPQRPRRQLLELLAG